MTGGGVGLNASLIKVNEGVYMKVYTNFFEVSLRGLKMGVQEKAVGGLPTAFLGF